MKSQNSRKIAALFDFKPLGKKKPMREDFYGLDDDPRHVSVTSLCHNICARIPSHKLGGIWVPRLEAALVQPKVSYVYLLVHQSENRFKIGMSISPKTRFENLPEANDVDRVHSLQVLVRDQRRARQVETLLHKALADYRLRHVAWHDGPQLMASDKLGWTADERWDGFTEWFALPAFRHAIAIIKTLPGLNGHYSTAVQTLEGAPWTECAVEISPEEGRLAAVSQYNLAKIDEIEDALMVISRKHEIVWSPSSASKLSAGTLHINGFKAKWVADMDMHRSSLMSNALWEFKTGQKIPAARPKTKQYADLPPLLMCPLVKLIRYSKTNAEDLELVFNSVVEISKVPSGRKVMKRWLHFSASLVQVVDKTHTAPNCIKP
jgi:hypothetical protein